MNLTDEEVIPLLDALSKNDHVTSLNLRRNRIGIEGCSTLASMILDNRTLTMIDVSGNNLGDEGLEDLSKVIPYNKTLYTLNVEDNKIGDVGASSLAMALMENDCLTTINLSGNLIGDGGASDLFKVLSGSNDMVTSLLLRFNAISDKGATELASALLDNESLTEVDLGHNKITNAGAKDLLKVVGINDTLEILELGGNLGIEEDLLEEVQRALEEEGESDDDDESGSGSGSSSSESSGGGESEGSETSFSVSPRKGGGVESESDESAESVTPTADELHNASLHDEESDSDAPMTTATGGEAMLQDMPDETNVALAKRKLIQQIMQDKSLNGAERNKKIQDVMAGRVELPKVVVEQKKPRARGSSRPADDNLTGGEAMLTDMPDEDDTALAKRKAIQEVMKDKSLSGPERAKKMQDIMAGRVALPKLKKGEPKKPRSSAAGGSANAAKAKKKRSGVVDDDNDSSSDGEDQQQTNATATAAASSGGSYNVDDRGQSNDGAPATGGEAMLTDMPDEDDTALAKRRAIQEVMKDKSLSGAERSKKMQDIMAGRVDLSKVKISKKAEEEEAPPQRDALLRRASLQKIQSIMSIHDDDGDKGGNKKPQAKTTKSKAAVAPPLTRRRSRRRIQPKTEESDSDSSDSILETAPRRRPPPRRRQQQRRKTVSSDSSESSSESSSSLSEEEEEEAIDNTPTPTPPAAAAAAASNNAAPTGGEAMLTDMPDETNVALAKRKAIQAVMQDKSLNGTERNKKIQDIMTGRVALPKVVESTKQPPPVIQAKEPANPAGGGGGRARQVQKEESESSESSSGYDSETDSHQTGGGSSVENNDSNVAEASSSNGDAPTGGEAMLTDMADEDDIALAKRRAIQEVMKDKSLSGAERSKKMQDIMAGRVKLPPPPAKSKAAPPQSKAVVPQKTIEPPVSKATSTLKTTRDQKAVVPANKSSRRGPSDDRLAKSEKVKNEAKPVEQVDITTKSSDAVHNNELLPKRKPKAAATTALMRHPSYDGGTRTAIAHEWKQRMMAIHPRSHDNLLDTLLAHQYRLSLKSPPCQSFFRVVAIVFFSRVVDGVRRSERFHVVGTNDEPHSIAGSICAERAALMQLRFIPDLESITKVVIVTDDVDAISPGMLCREFMASHDRIPWEVPIVLGRSVCRKCGFTVSGKACGDDNGNFNEAAGDVNSSIFATCTKGHEETKNKDYPTPHDFVGTITTLRNLFPYPSLYTRLSSKEALQFGENFIGGDGPNSPLSKNKKEDKIRAYLANGNKRFNADGSGSTGSYRQERFDLTMLTDILEEDEDGGDKSSHGSFISNGRKGSFTSNTSSSRQRRNNVVSRSSMTNSLKTTIDFVRQVREEPERHDLNVSCLSGLSDLSGALEHLTARTIRISSRLKPSQRREKLMRLAMEVTALESHQKHAHPIRYGAAVLFSDGTVAIASQKVALEYGCTLDAVGQLASSIDRKAIQIEEDSPPCRPILLVQCDQFGIAHAPFAPGRAFLTERGYGDCKVLIHQKRQTAQPTSINEEPNNTNNNDDDAATGDVGKEEKSSSNNNRNIDLRLLEVEANDLAPAPPDIFGGLMTKNHSQQGGLQIQF
ncbi:hypothetical protein ACHAXR_012437 [Thalassiosira sp. AJA248-18]